MANGRLVLVTGSTGFIGRRLIPELLRRGVRVRCLVRNSSAEVPTGAEKVVGDLLRRESLEGLFSGVDVAYYLVHSIKSGASFGENDRIAAENFTAEADSTGLRRAVYLGGLGEGELSPHLASRREVAAILGRGGFLLTVLRAPIIIGSGGGSYEIIRGMVHRLPVIPAPPWVHTLCQPIAVGDVVRYLAGCMDEEGTAGGTFDIGGPDILTYRDIIERVAASEGRVRVVVPTPLVTERIIALFGGLLAPVDPALSAALLPGMRNEVVCGERRISRLIPFDPTPLDDALRAAREEEQRQA